MNSKRINNWGLKLAALGAAIIIWFVIVNVDDPMSTRTFNNVPVTMTNESFITNSGRIYQVMNDTNEVTVTVKGKRSVLSNIRKEDITATADLQNIQYDTLVPITITITAYEGMYSEAEALPRNVEISIEDNKSVTLPVSVTKNGAPKSGYFVQSETVDPDAVTISGPASKISKIAGVRVIAEVTGLDKDKDFDCSFTYYDANGIAIDDSLLTTNTENGTAHVHLEIRPAKKVPIRVGYVGTVKEGYELADLNCDVNAVYIIGKQECLDAVEQIVIPDEVMDVTDAVSDIKNVVELADYLPEGVSLAEGETTKLLITAVIQRFGTVTIDFPVGSIVVNNAPRGYGINYGDVSEVDITFRGSEERLSELTAGNINVSIDLQGINEPGTYDVRISASAENGCVYEGEVSLQITLDKKN